MSTHVEPWMEKYKREADEKKVGLILSSDGRDAIVEAWAEELFKEFGLTASNLDAPKKFAIRQAISGAVKRAEQHISAHAPAVGELVEAAKQLLTFGADIHPMTLCHVDFKRAADHGCVVCALRAALEAVEKAK